MSGPGISLDKLALLASALAGVSAALGVVGTQVFNWARARSTSKKEATEMAVASKKADLDKEAADDAASDRLIGLIGQEADKRVAIVRAEFELAIANLKLEHAKELNTVRADFEREIATVRQSAETYHCDVAPTCLHRVSASKQESAVG